MQKLLFPSDLPSNKRMDISAKYIPRHEVGGDYYDFIPLNDEEYIILIADVSGKGTVLTITQQLQIAASKARAKPCPPDHCPTCFNTRCRYLLIGHCICTGHISPKPPRPFP